MVLLVFDLDETLLPSHYFGAINRELPLNRTWGNSINYVYQKHIPRDVRLQKLLEENPYPKFIATNATMYHLTASTTALGIIRFFQDMQYRRDFQKPFPQYYEITTKMLQIYCENKRISFPRERIIFFDDLKENHIVPKQKAWITVWISNSRDVKPNYIDYVYPSIYEALLDVNNGCLTTSETVSTAMMKTKKKMELEI